MNVPLAAKSPMSCYIGPSFTRSAVVETGWHGEDSLNARFILFLFKEILHSPSPFSWLTGGVRIRIHTRPYTHTLLAHGV